MSVADKLPADEIMRDMARIAMEQATTYFAQMARKFSTEIPPDSRGRDALIAFARAIESANAQTWPNNGTPT